MMRPITFPNRPHNLALGVSVVLAVLLWLFIFSSVAV